MFFNALAEAVVEDYGILEGGWLEQSEIQEWVDNYQQMAYGPIEEDKEYAFAIHNPFLDNPDALNIATDLFSRVQITHQELPYSALGEFGSSCVGCRGTSAQG